MPKAKCTEGDKGFTIGSFIIFEGVRNQRPHISFYIPEECWPSQYNGMGCFTVDLESILELYLERFWEENSGERTLKVVSLLREYATRIEAEWKNKMLKKGGDRK